MELKEKNKRSGKTKEHYLKQKNQCFSYFKVNKEDLKKISESKFTIYDFINNSFSFSSTKKELTINLLEQLKKQPRSFKELVLLLNAKKSTLYFLCVALERSGLIEKRIEDSKYLLSQNFSDSLHAYADWWKKWVSL
ncbi:MAG: hypothetical protein ACP5O3_03830 [Candidatus Micrarchaeia archaeon]